MALEPKGFILSGSPNSVYDDNAPTLPDYVLESKRPILGICYGMQLLAHRLGGQVAWSARREYGPATLIVDEINNQLFTGWHSVNNNTVTNLQQVWMSHADKVEVLPTGFQPLAHSQNSPLAAAANVDLGYYAVQFHPEVVHTPQGKLVLQNFVHQVCACEPDWTPAHFIDETNNSNSRASRKRPCGSRVKWCVSTHL